MTRRFTIIDVAEKAGVSTSTVSRVMNGGGTTPDTREKVLSTARAINYRPNLFARGIRSSQKNCIGLLIAGELKEYNPWVEKAVMSIIFTLARTRYRCMTDICDREEGSLPKILENVDGCILLGNYPESFFSSLIEEKKLALATYNEKMPYENGVSLEVDEQVGMHSAVQHLLALNHENIGLVVVGTRYPSQRKRHAGYKKSMLHFGRGIEESLVSSCRDLTEGNGYSLGAALTEKLLRHRPDVSAIIYGSDFAAFGGLSILRHNGIRVPEDVSVIGFGNTDWARMMPPALTSVGVDYSELSQRLLSALEALMDSRHRMPDLRLEPVLIERETTARYSRGKGNKRFFPVYA